MVYGARMVAICVMRMFGGVWRKDVVMWVTRTLGGVRYEDVGHMCYLDAWRCGAGGMV